MGPLDGIKVIGFSHFAQAPMAMQSLGDMGADVINIERPGTGDFNRTHVPEEALGGESAYFMALNRNKRSITLDLKQQEAREVAKKLIAQSDVLVTNFRPGTLEKLGLGFDVCKELSPGIIFAEAVGYAGEGPYAKLPGQDLLAQCLSGFTTLVGEDGPPRSGGTYVIDMYSSALLTASICAALVNKQNGGKAQKIEVNLLNSALHLMCQEYAHFLNTGKLPQRPAKYSSQAHSEAPYGIYETADGYIGISNVGPEKIGLFGEVIGVAGLPERCPSKNVMLRDRNELWEDIAPAIKKQTTAHWMEKFQQAGLWCMKVNTFADVDEDPQVKYNNIIRTMDHPTAGKVRVIGPPVIFSETPADIHRRPPLLGEHTEEILREAGYSDQEIAAMQEKNLF